MRPHVSFSELNLFKNECQWRWKLDYLEGKRSENFGVYLDFGTAVHSAIEHYKTRKNPCSLEEAVNDFRWGFCLLWGEQSPKYTKKERDIDPNDFLMAGERVLRHLHECKELWDAEVVYNEFPLKVVIERTDGLEIMFKGYIDMVIKTVDGRGNTILYVCDFKGCSWGWDGEKRRDRNMHAQLFLYKHFLCRKFNLDPDGVRTAFVLLKRRPPKGTCPVEFFPVSAGPVSVQRALDTLNSTISEMSDRATRNDFVKNRKACTNQFGQRCPYLDTELCPK